MIAPTVLSLRIMAAFQPEKHASYTSVKVTSALCAVWCLLLFGFVFLSLKLKFPFDMVIQPLLGVEVLVSIITSVNIAVCAVSSARSRFKVRNALKCVCGIAAASVVFHVIAILFGAPGLQSSRETYHFAVLMASLTALPAFCVLGVDGDKWTYVFALGRPALGNETVVFITSISSVVGAWLGAVPMPLDWDLPWQVWPVSCVLGALFGYCLGFLASAVYLPLKHKQLSKNKLS